MAGVGEAGNINWKITLWIQKGYSEELLEDGPGAPEKKRGRQNLKAKIILKRGGDINKNPVPED